MNIKNLKSHHEWEDLPCEKNSTCFHCKCKKQFDSIPKNNFNINYKDLDDNLINLEISEITINYGAKDEVIGWTF